MAVAPPAQEGRCPVCRARFRGVPACSRCGADLAPLMDLSAQAWRLRADARQAIHLGDFALARRLSAAAQRRCATDAGRRLLLLASWLAG